jgi:hypothetical protein
LSFTDRDGSFDLLELLWKKVIWYKIVDSQNCDNNRLTLVFIVHIATDCFFIGWIPVCNLVGWTLSSYIQQGNKEASRMVPSFSRLWNSCRL